VLISGVRGHDKKKVWYDHGSFNPVRISGVRGLNNHQTPIPTVAFQSGADFWGPGTRMRIARWVPILSFQSGADFWGPGTPTRFFNGGNSLVSIRCGFLGSGDPSTLESRRSR